MKLRWAMPTTDFISDPQMEKLLLSMRDNMSDMAKNLMSRSDLVSAGVLKVNSLGNYITAATTTTSTTVSSASPVSYRSFIFTVGAPLINVAGYINFTLPANTRVIKSWYEVTTSFTGSAGAQFCIRVKYDGTNYADIVSLSNISTAWAAGKYDGLQTGGAASFTSKMTEVRSMEYLTSGTVNGGKVNVFLEYALIG